MNELSIGIAVEDSVLTTCSKCQGKRLIAVTYPEGVYTFTCPQCKGAGSYHTVKIDMSQPPIIWPVTKKITAVVGDFFWKGAFAIEPDRHGMDPIAEIELDAIKTPFEGSWEEWWAEHAHLATTLPNGTKCIGLINYPDRLRNPPEPEPDVIVGGTDAE